MIELKDEYGKVFYDKLKFIYIELPKFTKTITELESHYEKWLYVLKHLSQLQDRPLELQERVFERLFKAAEIASFTREELEEYEESLKQYRDIQNAIDTSKQEGRMEESDNVIKNGIRHGYSNEELAILTGRSIEEIEQIRAAQEQH